SVFDARFVLTNKSIMFNYSLENCSRVSLLIYNLQGNLIAPVISSIKQSRGDYKVTWQIDNKISTGVYFAILKIDTPNKSTTYKKKLILWR
ncbi:MAG: hypothetical protein NZ601_06400, partial [candidate division WOR-3 bacterium]|nr:hypothetical protein [candidate division WOR-3 bacterium]MDW7988438.1 hypothetical protein [candidate division WOR-3 bacterium]